jgi:hypothetical protein
MRARTKQLSRLGRIFADGRRIDRALKMAARDAIRKHELHDAPVVIWRDGHVAWVPARELSANAPMTSARGRTRSARRRR